VHILSVITILLFIFKPYILAHYHMKIHVEYGSSILLFGCFLLLLFFKKIIYRFLIIQSNQVIYRIIVRNFFYHGNEEISWFQRILNIENPQLFNANLQGEMNLHNFSTNYVENAFYFGTFTFWFYCHFFVFLFPY
jgi:hypothetical protein